jgi:XTP/dITP diphosphohydrolase
VLVVVRYVGDPAPLVACGEWRGAIARQPAGTGGFGYDPVFLVPELQLTAGELSIEVKNRISHRACALRSLRAALQP